MRLRLLYSIVVVSILVGIKASFERAWALAPWKNWCCSEAQELEWLQDRTAWYRLNYRELSTLLSRIPQDEDVWIEWSDPVGAFPLSEYYAEILQFYGAPRRFYAHQKTGQTAYHVKLYNGHWVTSSPGPLRASARWKSVKR
jgi:hypothetical protein